MMRWPLRRRNRALMGRTVEVVFTAAAALLIATGAAQSQRSTEQFIPLGQSPGISGIVTFLGEITGVDPVGRSVTMSRTAEPGMVTLTVARQTQIWLDRSLIKRPTLTGTFADLVPGSAVEVHFQDPERRQVADWIKIQSDRPN